MWVLSPSGPLTPSPPSHLICILRLTQSRLLDRSIGSYWTESSSGAGGMMARGADWRAGVEGGGAGAGKVMGILDSWLAHRRIDAHFRRFYFYLINIPLSLGGGEGSPWLPLFPRNRDGRLICIWWPHWPLISLVSASFIFDLINEAAAIITAQAESSAGNWFQHSRALNSTELICIWFPYPAQIPTHCQPPTSHLPPPPPMMMIIAVQMLL